MKVLMKPVDMISVNSREGILTPLKFKMIDKTGDTIIVKIDKVIDRNEEKIAGNRMLVFKVQSNIYNKQMVYEMKYEITSCKWYIFKM